MASTLLIGTNNEGKAKELAELLQGLPWVVKGLGDLPTVPEPVEDQDTFEANAKLKAAYFCECFGVACVADDSGLVVDALDGAPGVYSARYSGPECDSKKNVAKLLDALQGLPWSERTARFVCCAAFQRPGEAPHIEMGQVEGHIAVAATGGGGFGYDPIFVPTGEERTFAEMSPAEKHRLSHRGQAFSKLRVHLEGLS